MNDGFNWFVVMVAAVGFAVGVLVGAHRGDWTLWLAAGATVLAIIALFKFIYSPVKGAEDGQGEG